MIYSINDSPVHLRFHLKIAFVSSLLSESEVHVIDLVLTGASIWGARTRLQSKKKWMHTPRVKTTSGVRQGF